MTDGEVLERLMGLALAADDEARYDLFNVRMLTAKESCDSKTAVDLLSFVSKSSPLVGLERAYVKWVTALESLESLTDSAAKPAMGQDVQDAFDAWLTAFRGVDYFTQEWITRRPDAESLAKRFRAFTNDEFDANAAYRACTALRNVAQHAGKTINAMAWGTTYEPGGPEEVSHYVDACVNLPKLAEQSGGWLSGARRREFEAVDSLVSVELLVGFATQSCVRMFYRLVDAVGPDVEAASGVVAGFHQEAVAAGGASAVFVLNAEGFARSESGMTMRNNGHDELIAVHNSLPEVQHAVTMPVHVSWDAVVAR